jgi:hypothetical protein
MHDDIRLLPGDCTELNRLRTLHDHYATTVRLLEEQMKVIVLRYGVDIEHENWTADLDAGKLIYHEPETPAPHPEHE